MINIIYGYKMRFIITLMLQCLSDSFYLPKVSSTTINSTIELRFTLRRWMHGQISSSAHFIGILDSSQNKLSSKSSGWVSGGKLGKVKVILLMAPTRHVSPISEIFHMLITRPCIDNNFRQLTHKMPIMSMPKNAVGRLMVVIEAKVKSVIWFNIGNVGPFNIRRQVRYAEIFCVFQSACCIGMI